MKTIQDLRTRFIDRLRIWFERPGAMGVTDEVLWVLQDLCFIDDQLDRWEAERNRLSTQGRYSNLGVFGPFYWHLPLPEHEGVPHPGSYGVRIGSVYAEMACRLGYQKVYRDLTASEWSILLDDLNRFRNGDWHQADVTRRYGPPSFVTGNPRSGCTLCYAPNDSDSAWICFDFEFVARGYLGFSRSSDKGAHALFIDGKPWSEHPDVNNPLLRHVRFPAKDFPSGLLSTEYAARIQKGVSAQ